MIACIICGQNLMYCDCLNGQDAPPPNIHWYTYLLSDYWRYQKIILRHAAWGLVGLLALPFIILWYFDQWIQNN